MTVTEVSSRSNSVLAKPPVSPPGDDSVEVDRTGIVREQYGDGVQPKPHDGGYQVSYSYDDAGEVEDYLFRRGEYFEGHIRAVWVPR